MMRESSEALANSHGTELRTGCLPILRFGSIGVTRLPILTRRYPRGETARSGRPYCRSAVGGTAINEKSWSERVAHLTRLAIGCLSLTLNAPLSAQTRPTEPTDSPTAATSTATATPGPTPVASDSVPPQATVPARVGPGSEAVTGSGVPTYKQLRYDEDYRYLKDPDHPHRLLGPHQVHPHRGPRRLVRVLRCPITAVVSILRQL